VVKSARAELDPGPAPWRRDIADGWNDREVRQVGDGREDRRSGSARQPAAVKRGAHQPQDCRRGQMADGAEAHLGLLIEIETEQPLERLRRDPARRAAADAHLGVRRDAHHRAADCAGEKSIDGTPADSPHVLDD
jgi:hypothetical protein